MILRGQTYSAGGGERTTSDDLYREWASVFEPGGEAFQETAGDVLHQQNRQRKPSAQSAEELNESARAAGRTDDAEGPVASQAPGNASLRRRRPVLDPPADDFHLAHDGELGAQVLRERLVLIR